MYIHAYTHPHRQMQKHAHKHILYTQELYIHIMHTHTTAIYTSHTYTPPSYTTYTHTIPNSVFNDIVNNLPVYFTQIVLKRLNLKVKPLSLSSAKIQAHYSLDCQPAQRALSLG